MPAIASLNAALADDLRALVAQSMRTRAEDGLCHLDQLAAQTTLRIPGEVVTSASPPALLNEFVDQDVVQDLAEANAILNWHPALAKVIPIRTTADHNCLCHGVSIALWGIQDEGLLLRQAVHGALLAARPAAWFQARWRAMIVAHDVESFGTEIERSEEEWEKEWQMELALAADPGSSLTEIHVYVLANVIRRPIVVYARSTVKDFFGQDMAPCYFGGVYLPDLWRPCDAFRDPVLLAYHEAHFTALVPMEAKDRSALYAPLVTPSAEGLRLQFAFDAALAPLTPGWAAALRGWMDVGTASSLPGLCAGLAAEGGAVFTAEIRKLLQAEQRAVTAVAPHLSPPLSAWPAAPLPVPDASPAVPMEYAG
eukprot:EG_transcript_6448